MFKKITLASFRKPTLVAATAFIVVMGGFFVVASQASAATATFVNLGTAGDFAVLSKAAITNVPTSAITGNIGASPITGASIGVTCAEMMTGKIYEVNSGYVGADITCVKPGTTSGTPNADKTYVDSAILDMGTAYAAATDVTANPAGTGTFLNAGSPAGTLSGQTLVPGVYTWSTAVAITDDIYLNGNSTDVWVFQISGTLNISSGKQIHLIGGALAKNVFWAVTGNVTLGTTSVFEGNILTTGTSHIALLTGATLHGRALSDGEVWLDSSIVTVPPAAPAACTGAIGSPLVVDVTQNITNDVDSGFHGNWALDDYARHIQVWLDNGTTYCAQVDYNGTFHAPAGVLSPGAGDTNHRKYRRHNDGWLPCVDCGNTPRLSDYTHNR